MNNIQIFSNEEFGKVRIIDIDSKPYAVANDVALALGYKKPNNAINTHCKHATLFEGIDSLGKVNRYNVIPESDIYRLIMKSQLPEAEKFELWVFDDILPSIRKYGMYAKDELLNNPELLLDVAQKLIDEKNKVLQLETKIEEQKPKVEIYDEVINQKGLLNFKQLSEIFGRYSRTKLFRLLREEHILSNNEPNWNLPYSKYQKYFKVKITPRKTNGGMKEVCTTLCVMDAIPFIKKVIDKKERLDHSSQKLNT